MTPVCGRHSCVCPGAQSRRSVSSRIPPQETGVLSTLNGGHLKMGVSLVVVCSVDSWDLGEKKTNFYFLDYKFVILGIVAFV